MKQMSTLDKEKLSKSLSSTIPAIEQEQWRLVGALSMDELAALALAIGEAKRIFMVGAGRTGLMMKAAAMRFMHLGLTVHVVGETTTPAISEGDLLLAASGSGTTSSIVNAALKARSAGAKIIAVSTTRTSPLAAAADSVILIPAAQKQDFHGTGSEQYAGSLFEQSVLLIFDGIFQSLWKSSTLPPEELWKRHANLE